MRTYPVDPKVFLQLDKNLIGYLKNRPCMNKIAKSACDSFFKINDRGYKFETTWPVIHDATIFEIKIAGHMEIDNDGNLIFLSYVFCVCRDKSILRKYHYDYECSQGRNKPKFHIQYGGNPLPSSEDFDGVDLLASWLSEPRLFYTPMSLALVLDQAFLEFPDDDTEKIRKDANWKGHLVDAQNKILAPYFERCLTKMRNKERLYAECYV